MGGPVSDTIPPSTPANLSATPSSSSRIDLGWNAATDNVAVAEYRVFRDHMFLAAVTGTSTPDEGRTPGISYCYTVSARDSSGNESAPSAPACAVTVNRAPQAILYEPGSALTGEPITFDASGSRDTDGTIATYSFDFGDGSSSPAAAVPTAQHAYAAAGIYPVTMTVTDNFGTQSSATRRASVGAALLHTVNLSLSPGHTSQREWFSGPGSAPIDAVWEEDGVTLLFSRSIDAGNTFSTGVNIIAPTSPFQPDNGYESSQMRVASVSGGSAIHIVWTIFDVFEGLAEEFYAHSFDGGATFSEPELISPNDRLNSYGPDIAADPSGTVAITWNNDVEPGFTPGAGFSVSTDTGRTFSTPILFPGYILCPAAAIAGNDIYVAWIEGPTFQEQVRVAHSDNRGASFSPPVTVEPTTEQSACPQIATGPGGAVFLTWREGPTGGATRILFSYSSGGGAAFHEPVQVSPSGTAADCPAIAIGDGRVYVTWSSYDSTLYNTRSWLVFSEDQGSSFGVPRWIPNPAAGMGIGAAGCYQILPRGSNELGAVWSYYLPNVYNDIYYTRVRISIP